MTFARSKWYTSALAFFLLTLASCDSTDSPSSMSIGPGQMSLSAPGILARAVDSNALFAEVTLSYESNSGPFTRTETASRTNGSNTWDVVLDIPVNTEFVLDIVWYDMVDPDRVNLTSLSRTFSTAGANEILTLSFNFSDFDSSAFNIDADQFTNLEERINGTSPFENDDELFADSLVFRYEEGSSNTINPQTITQDTTPVIGARWRRLTTSSDNAIACAAQPGFDALLAAESLEEACTTADDCTFDFDQVDSGSQIGNGIEFSVEVPSLQASVGLTYGIEITNSAQQVSFDTYEFCLIAINEAPVAVDDSFTVTQGTVLEVTASQGVNLLSNDSDDIDVSNLPLAVIVTPTRAPALASTFTLNSDGGFTYLYDPATATATNEDLTDSFEYTISDGIFTSTASVTLDIVRTDRPPVQTSNIPAQTAVVGINTSFDLSDRFEDPEDSELSFSAVAATLPPSGGLSVTDTGLFRGVAESGDEGTYVVEIIARDQTSSVAGTMALEVVANQRPTARSIADVQDVVAGQVISVDAGQSFSDPEDQPLRFSLESRPSSGLQINRNTGLITGQIAEAGEYTITVTASDGITQPVSSEFTVTRVPTPAAILSDPTPGSLRFSARVSESDSGTINFRNTGNASLTYSVSSNQPWLTTSRNSGTLGAGDRVELDVSAVCGQLVERRTGTITIGGNGGVKTVSVSLECSAAQMAILGDPDPDSLSLAALVSESDGTGGSDSGTFSFGNIGTAELTYSVSSDRPWLSVSADTGSLVAGANTQVEVSAFCGSTVETRRGTITIGGNGGESTVSVSLECSEEQTAILGDPDPGSLSLAALVSDGEGPGGSDSGTFSFGNIGTAELTYSVSSNQPWLTASVATGSLAAGANTQVEVSAVCGSTVETRRGTISIGGNGGESTVSVSLECSEAQIAILGDPDPGSLSLAALLSNDEGAGGSDSGSVRFSNIGTAELTISVSSDQPWLSASTSTVSLAAGDSGQLDVSAVCGTVVETRRGMITIGGNGGEKTVSVSLECSEAQMPILGDPDPDSLSLAALASNDEGPGGSDSGTFSFGNIGTAELTYSVRSNQPWLSVSADTGSLAAGENTQVEVSAVCGSTVETRRGTITIGSNGGEKTVSVSLDCSAPLVGILGDPEPDFLSLRAQAVTLFMSAPGSGVDSGSTTVSNIGSAELNYTISSNQEWLTTNVSEGRLAPGESNQIEVTAGCGLVVETRTGSITMRSGGDEKTVSVSLECTETQIGRLGDAVPASLNVEAFLNESATGRLSFSNIGNGDLTYTVTIEIEDPSTDTDGTFIDTDGTFTGTLAAGEAAEFTLTVNCGTISKTLEGSLTIVGTGLGGNTRTIRVPITLICESFLI